ncbi:MAG TPA: antibiotic biosynthesis monooxygenase [Candidatus Binataceae bacterium]|nr:antibiotic biosynthesis monooxygenase [Candidatus Binataceae bacterium]
MATLPWRSLGAVDREREYLALLSFLPLRHVWSLPSFAMQSSRILAQLQHAPGLLGYSLLARPLRKHFWTLSVWENEAALHAFVGAGAHAVTMRSLAPYMGATRFIRWKIHGTRIPPKWADAMDRWTTQS